MVAEPLGEVLRRTLFELSRGDAPDPGLLQRFAQHRDEAAFATLVRRHGPMVLRLCRRQLRQEQDAEDAFQATFLVLARRAGAIRQPEQLANWLYGVARHITACKLRSAARRHRSHGDHYGGDLVKEEVAARPQAESHDLRPILDEELGRLPERYRAPLVLCYLEGRSVDEAAAELGVARGTVASRMSRGRDLLRKRLTRRGLALSAAALTAQLESTANAAVPAAMLQALVPAGFTSGAGVRENAAMLAKVALQGMFWSKVRWGGILLACLLVLGTAAVKWATRTGKPAANGSVAAEPGDDFFVRYRFDKQPIVPGRPHKDIQVRGGQWAWGPGKGVVVTEGLFLLPARLPKRPLAVSVKIKGPPLEPGSSSYCLLGPVSEDGSPVPYVGWWNQNKVRYRAGDRFQFYQIDRWRITVVGKEIKEVKRYTKPYPADRVDLYLKNIAIEEIELRALQRTERPAAMQNIEKTIATMKTGPRYVDGRGQMWDEHGKLLQPSRRIDNFQVYP